MMDFPHPLKTIIFDLDGVLVDSEALHQKAKQRAFDHYHLQVAPELFPQFKGRTDRTFFTRMMELHPAWKGKVTVEQLVDFKTEAFVRLYPEITPIPGVLEFLQKAVENKIQMAVVTSATELSQKFAFDLLGINEIMSVAVNASHVRKHKPDPEPYLFALKMLGKLGHLDNPGNTHDCLVIEDSPSGILAAKGAGIFVVGLETSFPKEDLISAGADLVVKDYWELERKLGW